MAVALAHRLPLHQVPGPPALAHQVVGGDPHAVGEGPVQQVRRQEVLLRLAPHLCQAAPAGLAAGNSSEPVDLKGR